MLSKDTSVFQIRKAMPLFLIIPDRPFIQDSGYLCAHLIYYTCSHGMDFARTQVVCNKKRLPPEGAAFLMAGK
jgi:hypothetical protein